MQVQEPVDIKSERQLSFDIKEQDMDFEEIFKDFDFDLNPEIATTCGDILKSTPSNSERVDWNSMEVEESFFSAIDFDTWKGAIENVNLLAEPFWSSDAFKVPYPNSITGSDDESSVSSHSVSTSGRKRKLLVTEASTTKKKQGLTTSKFNGVCWNKRKGKWRARLSNHGVREFLGDFETEEDAAKAFDSRMKQIYTVEVYERRLNFK